MQSLNNALKIGIKAQKKVTKWVGDIEYEVDNPDYSKRAKPTNFKPKKKKRKK